MSFGYCKTFIRQRIRKFIFDEGAYRPAFHGMENLKRKKRVPKFFSGEDYVYIIDNMNHEDGNLVIMYIDIERANNDGMIGLFVIEDPVLHN